MSLTLEYCTIEELLFDNGFREKRSLARLMNNPCIGSPGNVVVPTGNPFTSDMIPVDKETDDEWLGPGLKLCRNHVVAVNQEGIAMNLNSENCHHPLVR